MGSRRAIMLRLTIAVGVAAAIGAPNALAGSIPVPNGEQTYPHMTPRTGGRHRTFELSFTLAQAPGHNGMVSTAYRAVVSAPAHARASCSPTQPVPVTSGSAGELKRIALHPPTNGWCKGSYAVTVYLVRTQACGPPLAPAPRIPCPVYADQVVPIYPVTSVNTGQTHFTVR